MISLSLSQVRGAGCEHYTVNLPLYMSENAGDIFCSRLKMISFGLIKNIFFKEKKVKTKA